MGYDAIVIGSGFGGAISAARLAERGLKVLILERGPWWGPAGREQPREERREFPRGVRGLPRLLRAVHWSGGRRSREILLRRDGLFEYHGFESLDVVVSSGVGGGSLVYTNILEAPDAGFFDFYPPEITAESMRPYFERVRATLRPAPLPDRPEKNMAFERATLAAGLGKPVYPDLAIAWGKSAERAETAPNAVGVAQSTCNHCGHCVIGCEERAKTTMDLTYIPLALRHGAELRPLSEALAIGRSAKGYSVRYADWRGGRGEQRVVEAPRLILAAGTLNTLRLLFAARDRHRTLPDLPATLGANFAPNADLLGLATGTRALVESARGAAVNAFVPFRDGDAHRFVVAEVGLGLGVLPLPASLRRGLARSAGFIAMGREATRGRIEYDGRGLRSTVGRGLDPALFRNEEDAIARIAAEYGPRRVLVNLPAGRGRRRLASVHPMGGCGIGRDASEGFTDPQGQVFGHPGLHVADGSLFPCSPGVPPSLTIAAMAERLADHLE